MWGDITIAFLLAFITAYVITPYTIRLAHKVGALDVPKDSRKIHKGVMPRLGGLSVITGFILSVIYLLIVLSFEKSIDLFGVDNYGIKLLGFLGGIILLGIFCFIDDLKGIPALVKLAGQILAAIVVVCSGLVIDKISIGNIAAFNNPIFLKVFTVIWIVGITNAINLIDGLDGLSSGICLISCVSLLIIFALNGSPLISIILVTALARCNTWIFTF